MDSKQDNQVQEVNLLPKMDRSVGLIETVIEDSKSRKVTMFSDGTKKIDHKNHIPEGFYDNPLIGEGGEGQAFNIQ